MGGIGTGELVIILLIVLVFFGGAKLPGLARSLGQAQREFRKGNVEGLDDETTKGDAPTGEAPKVDEAKDDKPAT